MEILKALLGEAIGMFVDDGSLAIAILVVVCVSAWISLRFEAHLAIGLILLLGSLALLSENVIRTARKQN